VQLAANSDSSDGQLEAHWRRESKRLPYRHLGAEALHLHSRPVLSSLSLVREVLTKLYNVPHILSTPVKGVQCVAGIVWTLAGEPD